MRTASLILGIVATALGSLLAVGHGLYWWAQTADLGREYQSRFALSVTGGTIALCLFCLFGAVAARTHPKWGAAILVTGSAGLLYFGTVWAILPSLLFLIAGGLAWFAPTSQTHPRAAATPTPERSQPH